MSEAQPELRYIIMGHLHIELDKEVGPDCRLIILGNWIDGSTYAVFDGTQLQLKNF